MPPSFTPLVRPGVDQSVDSSAPDNNAAYRFFLPAVADKIDFKKPVYDKRNKKVTVFRAFPHVSFTEPDAFEPYRVDPGGRNGFGWWMKRLHVAWNVGKPATSFIVHNPAWGPFDPRMTPLNLLVKAIGHAVKKGQGKAQDWANQIRRPFDPDPATTLEWSGFRDGGDNQGAALTPPKELYLMQGIVPMLGGELQFGGPKTMPGWGKNPTCVFGLTGGAGKRLLELLGQDREGYRGDPGDFESRYVNGDPVALDKGRFIYVYPKGGDPRQARYASQPTQVDMYAAGSGGVPSKAQEKEEVGFDLHLEKDFQGISASMNSEQHRKMIYEKWLFWDEVRDHTGRVVNPGILWYPTYVEQAQLLGRLFPASMLEYAFFGEHNDWLTPDLLAKSRAARSASVPQHPPSIWGQPAPAGVHGPGAAYSPPAARAMPAAPAGIADSPFAPPPGWEASAPPPFNTPQGPAAKSVPDQVLPTPAAPATPAPPAQAVLSPGGVDDILRNMAAEADAAFGPGPSAPAAPPVPAQPVPAQLAAGFDATPASPADDVARRNNTSIAALAAAKQKMKD